jgi:class 3 adenylate cyclase
VPAAADVDLAEEEGAESSRVLATILFIDIVASTEKMALIGDRAWVRLFAAFRAAVRSALTHCHGKEIATTGDGFLATFDGPSCAIRCAAVIHSAASRLGLAVRAGLHIGEVECDEDEINGLAVHIGARITALANADETLVSETVRQLLGGAAQSFAERGTHVLKGVPGQWPLYAVRAAGPGSSSHAAA